MLSSLKFSVITPSYNQAAFLEQTICSVIDQAGVQLEYFVYDGGSTDGSADIIRKYADRLADWSSAPDGGQTDAIVRAWSRATGEVVAWLNSDDYYLPGALAQVVKEFHNTAETRVVIGSCLTVDERGQARGDKYARGFNLPELLTTSGGVPGQPAVFVQRSLLDEIGLPDPALHYVMDWEYWIRLGLHLKPEQVRILYQPLAAARIWSGMKTLTGVKAICDEHRQVLERLFASNTLPPELQQLQTAAMAGTYFKQSFLEWQAGRSSEARRSLAQARLISKTGLTGYRQLLWQMRTCIPYPFYEWLQLRWGGALNYVRHLRPLAI